MAALRDLGLRNAGTPLLMASTPVRAAHPDANARATRNAPAMPMRPWSNPLSAVSSNSALSAGPRLPVTYWKNPTTAVVPMASMKR